LQLLYFPYFIAYNSIKSADFRIWPHYADRRKRHFSPGLGRQERRIVRSNPARIFVGWYGSNQEEKNKLSKTKWIGK
jgi:hypothetical protein